MVVAGVTVVLAAPASALYIVSQFGKAPVQKATAKGYGWPGDTLVLANHPFREQAWEPFFSECPNDVMHFGYRLRNVADANELLRAAGRMKEGKPRVVLSADARFRWEQKGPEGYEATFVLGSQKVLDEWWRRLPNGRFGVHVLPKPPAAAPPILTLYLGGSQFTRQQLEIPAGLEVAEPAPAKKQ
jgi:hypothetical protein